MEGKRAASLHLQGSFPPALPRNTHHLERPWLNRVADVIGEMVLIDQGAAKANAIKRQENIQR